MPDMVVHFQGAQINGIYEKDINLSISKKIQSSGQENIMWM